MDILRDIAGMFGTTQLTPGAQGSPSTDIKGAEGLNKLLGPAALGGIAGVLLGGKGIGGLIKGALVGGGGAYLWDQYKKRFREDNSGNPQFQTGTISPGGERAERAIKAMIFAARADGTIDQQERDNIMQKLNAMNLGREGQQVVQAAMSANVDPNTVARGVMDEEEALQLFTLTCSIVNSDNFMEKQYLDGLAEALHIPADVKSDIESKVHAS